MAIKNDVEKREANIPKIKLGSPEMEAFLAAGYPDIGTRAHAQEIIKTRKENPALVPWEQEQRALAFLAALDTKSTPIDTDPGRIDDFQTP